MLKCKTVRCLGVVWGGLATWCSPRIDSRMRARLYANKTEPPYGNTIKRKERFHAERTHAHGDRQKHHEEPSHYRPHDREIPAWPRTGTQIYAVPARTFLRGAVPLLQLQPLPLPRDNRATVLQESSSRNDDAQRYGLRLRKPILRRRHAHYFARRALPHHRYGRRELQHQRSRLRNQSKPPCRPLAFGTERPRESPFGGRAKLQQRAAHANGSLQEIWFGRRDSRTYRQRSIAFRLPQRRHDFQFPFSNRRDFA